MQIPSATPAAAQSPRLGALRGKRILVTGGAGFVGSNVARRLVELGADVTVLDDLSTGRRDLLPDGLRAFVKGSVADLDLVRDLVADASYVFHLAVRNIILSTSQPLDDCTVNIGGTLNVLVAARDLAAPPMIVYTSSASVYGNASVLPSPEESLPNILSPYAASKLAGESYCSAFYEMYQLPLAIVRYSNVYGTNQSPLNPYCGVISKFFDACMTDRPMRIHGSGLQTRDFTYIDDAVNATLLAAVTPKAEGEVVNVGTGRETSVRDLAHMIGETVGGPYQIELVERRDIDNIQRRVVRVEKARRLLRWSPNTPLESGLRLAYEWLRDYQLSAAEERAVSA
jgi:UDP-glucose 4-epimerase